MTLQVLSVASEAVPLVKTGGLADVVGLASLHVGPPGSLVELDFHATCQTPFYESIAGSSDTSFHQNVGKLHTAQAQKPRLSWDWHEMHFSCSSPLDSESRIVTDCEKGVGKMQMPASCRQGTARGGMIQCGQQ